MANNKETMGQLNGKRLTEMVCHNTKNYNQSYNYNKGNLKITC